MKKTFITSLAVLSLALTSTAGAQGLDVRVKASTTPVNARVEMKASSTSASTTKARAEFEARRASSTERRIEMQQGLAKMLAERTGKVLSMSVERVENLANRVASRIAKVKANGGVVTESEKFLAEARTHISEAKASVALFASIDLSADKAKDNFVKVREAAKAVKEHLKAAHKSLSDAVKNLKGARSGVNATTTVEVN